MVLYVPEGQVEQMLVPLFHDPAGHTVGAVVAAVVAAVVGGAVNGGGATHVLEPGDRVSAPLHM